MKIYSTRLIRLLLVAGSLALVACGDNTLAALTETHSDQANSTEDAAATKSSSKAKDTLEVRNMLAAFAKQAHRIEFNGCEMYYNGKPFELGMTIKELVDIFGPYDLFNRGFYVWKAAGIVFVVESNDENIDHKTEYIYLYTSPLSEADYAPALDHRMFIKKDIFLLEGVPLSKGFSIKDVIDTSIFSLDNFLISNNSYRLRYSCGNGIDTDYYLYSKGIWTYKGIGHLQLKSHPNKSNNHNVREIFIESVVR